MRRIAISVAAFTAMGLLVGAAQADNLLGAPAKSGNQCFKFTSADQVRDARFGAWGECPNTASVATAPKARKRAATR
jgi:hypothetical protein